ncbi:MAG: response regulator transcription factor [Nitrospirae bacterium]|nr:response regulator transcription factor [Nitrospirota bacterium]MDA1303109.1 response regulator transcription factor [Nitrospirota bacterium]
MSDVNSNAIRVLIADDHAVVRQGLKQILSKTPDLVVVDEAETGLEVLEKIRAMKIDVVVMDVEMPQKNGWEVLGELKTHFPRLPVVILSIYSEEQFGLRFLKAGASGYLTKTSAPDQLVEAIRRVAKGGKFVSPSLAERLVLDFGKDFEKPLHACLSDREFQVFHMIALGKPLKEIAEELSISTTTVSTHRARILEKMNMKTNADLTIYASQNGLMS